MKIIKKVLQN